MQRSLDWVDGTIVAVDQRALPHRYTTLQITTLDQLIDAIRQLAIRGAPAIGVAGALGVAQSVLRRTGPDGVDVAGVQRDAARLAQARPTAVNLGWGVQRALSRLPDGPDEVVAEAILLLGDDERVNRAASARAARLLRTLCPQRPLRVLTHCNTGGLATVAWGTALGTIRELASDGRIDEVLAGETRPLLQGARLTTWELANAGISHRLCVDAAGPAAIARGLVDCVIVGADRIAANGDVANKIGTYALAAAAARSRIPFVVVAPESTIDPALPDGTGIRIEERPAAEVTTIAGVDAATPGTRVYNPAFDVTPADLITAIVTEDRLFIAPRPARAEAVAAVCGLLYHRGWMDGTSGNVSARVPGDGSQAVITVSGRSKGALTAEDTVLVEAASGRPTGPGGQRPSAETAIHAALYRAFPSCGAVVHAHPPYATALSCYAQSRQQRQLQFSGLEISKGLGLPPGAAVTVPVFANWDDVGRIAGDISEYLAATGQRTGPVTPALLIAGHGATAWGPDLESARNRMECLEMLCRLQLLCDQPGTTAA